MKRLFAILFLSLSLAADLRAGVVEDVSPRRGRTVAPISWIDEKGRTHQLAEFAGYPVILLPIYTRCQTACVANVAQLKKTLADTTADPTQFRVLLFSFDHSDTPSTLARYRSREKIPLSWSIGTASRANIDALLDSIGFQYGEAGTEFVHPNLLMFLDSNLRIAKWIYGEDYSGGDVAAALKIAGGGSDWIGRHSDVLYALLLFAASIFCVLLCYHLLQLRLLHRTRRAT
jgi:protein SCO1